jgi:hypothetical protein
MSFFIRLAATFGVTCALMALWIILANTFGWGVFTGWGMAHGGFVVALPLCLVVASLVVSLGARVLSKRRSQRHW